MKLSKCIDQLIKVLPKGSTVELNFGTKKGAGLVAVNQTSDSHKVSFRTPTDPILADDEYWESVDENLLESFEDYLVTKPDGASYFRNRSYFEDFSIVMELNKLLSEELLPKFNDSIDVFLDAKYHKDHSLLYHQDPTLLKKRKVDE